MTVYVPTLIGCGITLWLAAIAVSIGGMCGVYVKVSYAFDRFMLSLFFICAISSGAIGVVVALGMWL